MGGRLIIPQSQSLYPLPLVGCQLHALPAIKARSCGCIDGIVRVAKTADTDKVNGNIIRSCPACREPLTEHRRRSVPWISTLIMFEILCHYHPLVSLSFVHTTQNQTEPDGVPYDYAHTVNKGHGRVARRECWTITAADGLDYINPHGQWPQLRAAIKVIGHRDIAAGGVVNLATASAVRRPQQDYCWTRYVAIGASTTRCIGLWMQPSEKTSGDCARITGHRTWPPCVGSHTTC